MLIKNKYSRLNPVSMDNKWTDYRVSVIDRFICTGNNSMPSSKGSVRIMQVFVERSSTVFVIASLD